MQGVFTHAETYSSDLCYEVTETCYEAKWQESRKPQRIHVPRKTLGKRQDWKFTKRGDNTNMVVSDLC